jgi:hypothetical protein
MRKEKQHPIIQKMLKRLKANALQIKKATHDRRQKENWEIASDKRWKKYERWWKEYDQRWAKRESARRKREKLSGKTNSGNLLSSSTNVKFVGTSKKSMDRDYDEIIADMLIQLEEIEQMRNDSKEWMKKFERRQDLTIRRMVKAEERLNKVEERLAGVDARMKAFDKKLNLSILKLERSITVQNKANIFFLAELRKGGKK